MTIEFTSPAEAQRSRQLLQALADEAVACGLPRKLRLGYPTPGGGMNWPWEAPNVSGGNHSYRCVLPNQLIFDVGDCNKASCRSDGHRVCWIACAVDTHAIWLALRWFKVPFWGSLSGGKGTHTEVFGPPQNLSEACKCTHAGTEHWGGLHRGEWAAGCMPGCDCQSYDKVVDDWRPIVAAAVHGLATRLRSGTAWGIPPVHDKLLVKPGWGSRQLREFGHQSEKGYTVGPKTLWTTGVSEIPPLPLRRGVAYREAQKRALLAPVTVPRTNLELALSSHNIQEGLGIACPKTPDCIDGACDDCPALR